MPLYVFECTECGKQGEVLGKMGDPDEYVFYCTKCDDFTIGKKVPSVCNFHLRGNGSVGWSHNGYASALTPENDTINPPERKPRVPVKVRMEPVSKTNND